MITNRFERYSQFRDTIVCLVMSVLFTALVINYSEKSGKLAFPPWYDDSHSMVEGALRLMTFQQEGARAAWMEYLTRPPHSFLHYYWTSLLYGMFGMKDSVVYWGNAVFIFLALLAMSSLLGRVGFCETHLDF